MRKFKVCLGSNDGKTIANTHLGDTESFYIYEINENSKPNFLKKVINSAIDMEHAKEEKMKVILGLVNEVQVLVATQKSPNFKKIASKTKFQPVVIKGSEIDGILEKITKSFDEVYKYIEKRKNGEIFETIPEI